jgi:glycosyltransferase involved in cell wall biosynthesis
MGFTRVKVLAVGMLPPPVGGQALMFERALNALQPDYDVTVINIQLQTNIGDAGLFSIRKLVTVARLLFAEIIPLLFHKQFDVLYYCLTGPSTLGAIKDLLFLTWLRLCARKTVYHFHAGGGVAYILKCNFVIRVWARLVLFRPDLVLHPPYGTPDDALLCRAKQTFVVFNAIEDPDPLVPEPARIWPEEQLSFCFIGAVTEEKGVFDLVEIARFLRERGHFTKFTMYIVGEGNQDELTKLNQIIRRYNLGSLIKLTGVLLGDEKFRTLKNSTLFLFPTFFRAETQPTAVMEAMAMGVPVIASDWRGISTIIEHGVNGYLVPPRDIRAFCVAIEKALSEGRIDSMRLAARKSFLEKFLISTFIRDIQIAFSSLT